jgi:fatty acyl-CoA reductase
MNLERLKRAMRTDENGVGHNFDFDTKSIDWADYFYSVHIPGVLKCMNG